jgi:hypothetical protein
VGAPGRLIGCLASGAWVLEGEEGVVVQEGGTSRKLDAPAKSLVALSPKGGYLAIAGPQRRIRIWSASPFTEKAELTAEGDVRALAVSDGGHLLAVYTGHLLRVLLQDGAVVGTFQTSELEALSFSADGSQLVGFSGDPQQADWVWALPPAEPEALVRWLAERSSDPYLDEAVTLGKDDILYKYKPLMGHDLP